MIIKQNKTKMTNENDLIKKLMVSKQIMEKHRQIPRAGAGGAIPQNIDIPEVQEFSAHQAKYSLPQEFIQESKSFSTPQKEMSQDRILSSKLPDEIKQLMIEHPIVQPNSMAGPSISNELVEKASRLMGTTPISEQNTKSKSAPSNSFGIDKETIKSIVRETIEEVLSENGLLVESTSKSNEVFSFRVGKHIFEGKVTKIKKVQ